MQALTTTSPPNPFGYSQTADLDSAYDMLQAVSVRNEQALGMPLHHRIGNRQSLAELLFRIHMALISGHQAPEEEKKNHPVPVLD